MALVGVVVPAGGAIVVIRAWASTILMPWLIPVGVVVGIVMMLFVARLVVGTFGTVIVGLGVAILVVVFLARNLRCSRHNCNNKVLISYNASTGSKYRQPCTIGGLTLDRLYPELMSTPYLWMQQYCWALPCPGPSHPV